jgi:hypothetical protein
MSMMADMMADMLKKALPPEVMELLTPENIKEIGDKANAFIADLRDGINEIKLEQVNQKVLLEEMKGLLDGYGNKDSKRGK